MSLAPAASALHVHVWLADQAHVAFLKLRVQVDGALVDVIRIPFDPDGDHQLEQVDDLACGTQYVVFVAPCSVEGDWLGGCGPELSATASTSPCVGPHPPPRPRPPPPPPPAPPRPPSPPSPPPGHTAADHGCKNPQAATFDPAATVDDPSLCVDASWGCTLPRADNYESRANLNDGSCRFDDSSVCAVSLTSLHWTARAAGATWPVSANRSADGSSCAIGPAVSYNRCLSLRPPPAKSVDVVLMFQLPLDAFAASVEVGLSPHAGRDAIAEFELRLVTALGDVVGSSLAVRARRGQRIPPALLRVELVEALRGTPGILLQLVVNNDGAGDVSSDLVVWAEPLLYCDAGCPCGGYAGLSSGGDTSGGDSSETGGATAGLRDDGRGSNASSRLGLATVGVLLLSAGLAFGVLKLGLVFCRRTCEDGHQEEEENPDDDLVELSGGYPDVYPDVGSRQSRVVGEVRINKRPKADERRNLMSREEEDDEEELQIARL